jgi:3alpha(or 20beta)-hydroxysteroid dehydrogenase
LAPYNIRVNSIHPGLIRTAMTAGIPEDFLQIPLGRGADPAEVSACGEFVVDGGLTIGVPHKTM